MTSVALAAEIRNETGKSGVNKVRARGLCPAVIYGRGTEAVSVSVDPKVFLKLVATAGENALIDLSVKDAGAAHKVIVREIQYDPLKPMPIHVDFSLPAVMRPTSVLAVLMTNPSS